MNYKIFVIINSTFGEIEMLEYKNRDLANIIAMDFIHSRIPVITVSGNKFKVHNALMMHQPEKVHPDDWPEVAKHEYSTHKDETNYLGGAVFDWDGLGCYEFCQRWIDKKSGATKKERIFLTYKETKMFSVVGYC